MDRSSFNPYRHWLGLPDPPRNYYELLGLEYGECDEVRIALAAAARLSRLRDFEPTEAGESTAVYQKLVKQVMMARDCLLSSERRVDYETRLRLKQHTDGDVRAMHGAGTDRGASGVSGRSGPPATTPAASPATKSQRAVDPMAPVEPLSSIDPMAPVDVTAPIAIPTIVLATARLPQVRPSREVTSPIGPVGPMGSVDPVGSANGASEGTVVVTPASSRVVPGCRTATRSSATRSRSRGRSAPVRWWVYGVATMCFVVLVGVFAVLIHERFAPPRRVADMAATEQSRNGLSGPTGNTGNTGDTGDKAQAGGAGARTTFSANAGSDADAPSSADMSAAALGSDDVELKVSLRPTPARSGSSPNSSGANSLRPTSVGTEASASGSPTRIMPTPAADARGMAEAGGMASTSMATPGRDREVSMSPRDAGVAGEPMTASDDAVGPRKALDTAAAAELETALVPIWSALQDRRIDDARSMLARAQRLAEGSEAEPRVDRYETLIDYVTQFWQAVEAGMQGLEGSELPLDRGLVFVVEVNSSHVVVRVQGANRRFPRDRIPPRFALAVADRWLNDQAASSQVFRGAFLAVTPQFTRDDAEAAWRDAQRRGAPLDDLLLILQERP